MNIEINKEALESLSMSDLLLLRLYYMEVNFVLYPKTAAKFRKVDEEISKREKDLFITD